MVNEIAIIIIAIGVVIVNASTQKSIGSLIDTNDKIISLINAHGEELTKNRNTIREMNQRIETLEARAARSKKRTKKEEE